MEPCRGAIAICSCGMLGVITSRTKVEVTYPDGSKGFAWTGLQLTDSQHARIGDPWSSREPKVVAYLG